MSGQRGHLAPYAAAYTACRTGITGRARAAELAATPVGAIENLELLRLTLHREVDYLLDAEADRYGPFLLMIPPPRDETS
ncbi:hypothetical protein ACIBCT_38735 [Streptosporangium sp. NPDC050855]|uniref:hypothetical protein n=1 Tax=Streptosporangium sp. NPDC050855 TaxID=3366194 RepID=UPI00379F408F